MKPKVTIKEHKYDETKDARPARRLEPGAILPRTFRWTLSSPEHPGIGNWMKKLFTDYRHRMIELEVYDDPDGAVYSWLMSFQGKDKTSLVLSHLDARHGDIAVLTFTDLELQEHSTEYNYEKSDVLTHKVKIHFKYLKRENAVR